ncbi:MAG: hemerythrin domain-containing protein [Actinomycetota bacterium]
MNALDLLEKDHREVEKMLEELDKTTVRGIKTRQEGLAKLKAELTVHETIEEEILYPALKENPKSKEVALEGFEEHHVVDMVMAEIEATPVDDETWGAKFSVMKENITHHIEEEEGEMFKKARQIFSKVELEEMGSVMEERKESLQKLQGAA